MDPDCCLQSSCQNQPFCRGLPDPQDIISQSQQSPSQQAAKSFYDRISFLIGPESTHVIPGESPFNKSLASVIRGQVLTADGTPLIGVNVSFLHYPDFGYTITRQDGMFDLVANGGASLTLVFERSPFLTQYHTVWIPWNVFYVMDTLVMKKEENDIPSCDLSGFVKPNPVIVSSPLSTLFRISPEDSPIIPETQVLHEETAIPGTDLKLSYLSSRAAGYKSVLKITMTQSVIPFNLMKVHLMVAVVGRLFQKWFPASPNLAYTFIWDKTDAYNQKVYGLSEAVVSVGYEYESCLDLTLWEKRTAILQGYELDASNMGGWTLDKHHVLDVQNGILYKGNGENQFISQQPPVVSSIMGNGRRRSISCPSCNGQADGNKLLAPVALACGIDGSLYVGDFNYVRRIFPSGNVTSVLELSSNPAHKYYLATDPVTGELYVSDTNTRRIYRPKLLTGTKDLTKNADVVAGTGEQCLPFDEARCGDGGKAVEATLMSPKGVTVDKNGLIYFVDGTMIRKVDQNGIISTLLGSNDLTSARPLTCDTSMHISQVRLEWPTDLAINPMDNSIYVLDNNVVLQITENRQVPQGQELVLFTYHGNSGLLSTRSDEIGWTTFFDYDSEGRLTNVTFPTGVVTNLHGEMERAITVDIESSSREDDVSITSNLSSIDSFYTMVQDQLRNSYQIGYDGSLRIIYASGLDTHYQTEPHVLAGTANPTVAKRNMTLPGENGQNLVEWRFRKEQAQGKVNVFGRKLRVNGRNLLSVDFDRTSKTEKIYDDHRKFLLRIAYDTSGHPTLWFPSSKLMAVNVTYSSTGQIGSIQRGTTSEKVDYDGQGRIVSRVFADGKTWSYTYLEKSMVLLLHSQRQYIFEYDLLDRLSAITMPSVARHTMQTIRSIGYYRNIYNPPESNASVIMDYNEEGQLLQTAFLGTSRRILFKYRRQTRLSEILYDSTRLVIGFHGGLYDPLTKLIHFGQRDYDILAGRWTTPDIEIWKKIGKDPAPFNLYMFRNNNPASRINDVKDYITDVNSWLVTFGFHLHNAIPGFPVPKFDLTEPSYELVKSQQWDDVPPISGVQQEVAREAKAFLSLGKMAEVQISKRRPGSEKSWLWFATVKSLIGKGVMLAVNQGKVQTNVLNIANEDCIKVAAVLNSAYYLENLHFTVEGKDTHYFIKTTSPESDLGTLRLTSGRKALENGINVTVSQSTTVVNGRTRRFADVEMQYGALALHVRYGMTLDEEKARILEQARQRALSNAWAREQQRVRDGEEGARLWTEGEKRQLLSAGKVQGYDGYYVLSVEQYPELADSANNIQFLRQSEIGKR
ncbi:teneurin-4 [Crotalus adamanteus]|uniref:Teneurin-4 n=1 Tax=Crotalus adamanteus TaxID=8729 RepID=A0AAW1BAI0_CROAD